MAESRVDRRKKSSAPAPAQDKWVTLKEASRVAGVSVSTLRNWYRKEVISSRTERGPNGEQRLVRLDEVTKRAGAADENASPNGEVDLVPVIEALPRLIKDLGEARERAGRAEAKVEMLTEELDQIRSRRENTSTARSELEQENRILQQRLVRLQSQAEQLARRLAAAEGAPPVAADDEVVEEIAPEEEDAYLSLTERWRARRKRKKEARLI